MKAFDYVERLIEFKRKNLIKPEIIQNDISNSIQNANKQAAELLFQGKGKASLKLLIRAKKLAGVLNDERLRASLKSLTFNSISSVYREL